MKLDPITEYILSEQIKTRIVSDGDRDIFNLFKASVKDDNEYIKKYNQEQREGSKQEFQERMKYTKLIVAYQNNKPIGIAFIKDNPKSAYIFDLFVDPDYRRKGVGSALLDGIERFCRDKKIKQIVLNIWESNKGAKNLYLKNGFKVVTTKFNVISMTKDL